MPPPSGWKCLSRPQHLPSGQQISRNFCRKGSYPVTRKKHERSGISGLVHHVGRSAVQERFSEPFLRCLSPDETQYVLVEIYEGICGSHLGGRALVARVSWAGYYWPQSLKDSETLPRNAQSVRSTGRFRTAWRRS
ncbi:uncharacterized protein LOC121260213 [Juglans microcarpa x Juglans regia]|uniref:uncharacterized protein LOC121260213 n=1 Tax=Juglans microcarpa x Juglans regia TaxID=2249226 RepID=UPI001B7E441B|nr:uncharacterized protein LOC121260213 [Juglans microcarpa x Juglans regia]